MSHEDPMSVNVISHAEAERHFSVYEDRANVRSVLKRSGNGLLHDLGEHI